MRFATPLAIIALAKDVKLAWLFFIALIPGVLSAVLALIAVKDIPHEAKESAKPPPIFQHYPRAMWQLALAVLIFSIGNSSDSFLLLKSKEMGLTFGHVILAYAVYNAVYAVAAGPLGGWSDRIGRKPIVAAGWVVYAAVYFGFGVFGRAGAAWGLLAVYGLYQALTDGVSKALVSDVVGKEQRAGAIGLFYTVAGLGQLVASILAGKLWPGHWWGVHAPFLIGSLCAFAAVPSRTMRQNPV